MHEIIHTYYSFLATIPPRYSSPYSNHEMVLEEVERSSPASYQDDAFSSTSDSPTNNNGFNNNNLSTYTYTVDVRQLPTGLPILGALFGYGEQRRTATINASLTAVTKIVRRELRPEEVNAVAYHTAKGLGIASYGFPIGVAGGLWRWNNTRNTFRFPFYAPNLETFKADKLGPLHGEVARRGWHILRGVSYGLVGGWIGRTVIAGYAATVAATGQRMDNRMKDIVDAITKMSREQRVQRGRESVTTGAQQQQQQTQQQQLQQQQEGTVDQSYGGYTRTSTGDTATSYNSSTDTGFMNDMATGSPDQRSQTSPSTYNAQNTSQPYSTRSPTSQSQDSIFEFDDASPTAGTQQSQNTSGNVWEQLRRGGGGGGGGAASPRSQDRQNAQQQSQNAGGSAWAGRSSDVQAEQRQGSTLGDSFSFARGSDEERRREREKAQREFDERVERERRGEEFESERKW